MFYTELKQNRELFSLMRITHKDVSTLQIVKGLFLVDSFLLSLDTVVLLSLWTENNQKPVSDILSVNLKVSEHVLLSTVLTSHKSLDIHLTRSDQPTVLHHFQHNTSLSCTVTVLTNGIS